MNQVSNTPDPRFAEYADVAAQIKTLEARKKVLSKELMDEYSDQLESNPKLGEMQFGTFKVYESKPNWTYSEELQDEMDALKERQLDEQDLGIAKKNPTKSLRFNAKKSKE